MDVKNSNTYFPMKKIFFFSIPILLMGSCGGNKSSVNIDSLRTDSALKAMDANGTSLAPDSIGKDSSSLAAMPIIMEGDLVFQNADDKQSLLLGKATKSKYNNVGIVYMRPKDRLYMVFDVRDSLHSVPLSEWIANGNGQHVALLRLKDANIILNEKKTQSLKATAKLLRGIKYDPYFNWNNEGFYCSELVWKLFKDGASIEISTPGKLSQLDLTDPALLKQMKTKYGAAIPKDETLVTPDDLYHSPKMEIIYER